MSISNLKDVAFNLFASHTPACNDPLQGCISPSQSERLKEILGYFAMVNKAEKCGTYPSNNIFLGCEDKNFLIQSKPEQHSIKVWEAYRPVENSIECSARIENGKSTLTCLGKKPDLKQYELQWDGSTPVEKINNTNWENSESIASYKHFLIDDPINDTPPNPSSDPNAAATNPGASDSLPDPGQQPPNGGTSEPTTSTNASSWPDLSKLSLNPTYLKAGAGIASTVFFTVKAYKETRKLLEESRCVHNGAHLRKTEASKWRALGYAGAAAGSAAFSIYTLA